MGNSEAKPTTLLEIGVTTAEAAAEKGEKKLKPCCACPETKKIRDTW